MIRRKIKNDTKISPWYRHNIIIYLDQKLPSTYLANFKKYKISDKHPIPDLSSNFYKLRCKVISKLPSR